MSIRSTYILIHLLVVSLGISAQPVIDVKDRFNHAKGLYERGAYKAARMEFAQVTEEPYQADSKYFLASSAILAGQADGEQLMNEFVEKYPFHIYTKNAFLEIADFFFEKKEFDKAVNHYKKSNNPLSKRRLFQLGYSHFKLDEYDESLESFKKLEGSFSSYETDAAYFIGYIYYEREDLKSAFEYLIQAFESNQYGIPATELYVSALYQRGEYQEIIELVNRELTPVKNGLVLNYLADAQYALEKYNSAAANYKTLFKSYGKFRNERNYFRAGYCSFKVENNEDAISYLKRSAVADDSVGAYASYYLGVIYSEMENWHFAITSFENTVKYLTVLKEDAIFHQARCLMKIPNYREAIDVFNGYLTNYQNGRFAVEVKELLGAAYAETNDYELAIQHIEELDRLTPELKMTYQRVSFLKGVSLFNDKKFTLAGEYFLKSLIHDMDAEVTQQTYYWMAECMTLQGSLDEALFYYKSVSSSPDNQTYMKAIYGVAYAHYNLKNYASAIKAYEQFEKSYTIDIKQRYLTDVLLRMGDCYFALKQYQKGIDYYEKAEKSGNKNRDHIYFQIGLLNRYLDEDQTAKQYFNRLIKELPTSSKVDHAYYQIAQIDYEKGESKKAIDAYDKLIRRYPSSDFIPYALLNQAVAYDNEGESGACIENYKEILDRFPRHQTANSALLGLQDKQATGEFEFFDDYLAKYKKANPNSEALENIEFESARANYYAQKYEFAIEGFQNFVKVYPKSSLIIEAKYLIADAYYRQNQVDKAINYFKEIESFIDYSKYDRVLYRLATLQSLQGNLSQSNQYYYKLAQASLSSRNVMNVNVGLMENHFLGSQYDSTIHYGNALLNNPKTSVLVSAQANLLIGKSYYEKENLEMAMQNFLPLVGNSPDERGAEAYYYISRIYYDQAKYEKALESLFILTDNFNSYEIWLGKAYLLMADIYIETNELFQAKATLNSLIAHATLEEVKTAAEAKLKLIEEAVGSNE